MIIPAKNVENTISQCLNSLCENLMNEIEIIVVLQKSSDHSHQIIQKYPVTILLVEEDNKSISYMRNLGASVARGELLVFLDSDIVISDQFFVSVEQLNKNHPKAIFSFTDKAPDDAHWVGRIWGMRQWIRRVGDVAVDFLPTRNLIVPKEIYVANNGFDELLITGEDKDFSLRAKEMGFEVISSDKITLIHLGYEKNFTEFIVKEYWRQSHTLLLWKQNKTQLRRLRNPFLALWHLIFMCINLGIFGFYFTIKLNYLMLWILPSLILIVFKIKRKVSMRDKILFWMLDFIRWHIAGMGVIHQLIRRC